MESGNLKNSNSEQESHSHQSIEWKHWKLQRQSYMAKEFSHFFCPTWNRLLLRSKIGKIICTLLRETTYLHTKLTVLYMEII